MIKKITIRLLVVVTTISLMALISMQLFWIKNAINLSSEQYDNRVTIALKDVLSDLIEINKDSTEHRNFFCALNCCNGSFLNRSFDKLLLDSLLHVNFEYQNIDTIFNYCISKSRNDSMLITKNSEWDEDKSKMYKICLGPICGSEKFNLEINFPQKQKFILVKMAVWMIVSVVFLLIVIFSYSFIVFTVLRQKKITKIKDDFIANMTHEFKTPISTISLASEVLKESDEKISAERIHKYSTIIFNENVRLQMLVERALHVAQIEANEIDLNKTEIDIHQTIDDVVRTLNLELCKRNANIDLKLNAPEPKILADKLYITHILSNLITNAYNYASDKCEIIISTANNDKGIFIYVEDNGIGISSEYQKRVFEKFFRIPTGNVHNVKGYGLGLYYVKTMVIAHKGTINLKSEINKGTKFEIFLPF